MYDLIGDIHGHADELVQLLKALGYAKFQGVYRHPERKVIFVGDFIDRGPKIRQVLEIVRPMIEEGKALAVMGNHELNALAFHAEVPNRAQSFLRKRDTKNIRQHGQTILQLNDEELNEALEWFRTLPMWLKLDGLRVVHACWDERAIAQIDEARKREGGLTPALLRDACSKEKSLFAPVEVVLKGKESKLPEGVSFLDKDGHVRTDIRTRWYLSPEGQTYRTYSFHQAGEITCDRPLEAVAIEEADPYPTSAPPVFFGHYWLSADGPEILAENVACLDFSVAKGGFLCAYRWNGEQKLSNENFVWVPAGKG
jgi:hypothetical protein